MIAERKPELPITDPEMTRFWITLQQGVDFVIKNFSRMKGGNIRPENTDSAPAGFG